MKPRKFRRCPMCNQYALIKRHSFQCDVCNLAIEDGLYAFPRPMDEYDFIQAVKRFVSDSSCNVTLEIKGGEADWLLHDET